MVLTIQNITDPTGVKLRTAVEAALTANSAWSFVKEVVISTFSYRVWLNNFSATYPFYVVLATNTAQVQQLYVFAAEQFNSTTNQVTGQTRGTSMSSYTTGGARAQAAMTTSNTNTIVVPSTGTHSARVFVENDGVVVAMSSVDVSVFAGLFVSLFTGITADEFPLCTMVMRSGSGANDAQYSRIPGATSGTLNPYGTTSAINSGAIGTGTLWLGGKSLLGPIRLQLDGESSMGRGLSPIWVLTASKGVAVIGDTVSVSGASYLFVSGSTSTLYGVRT